MPQLSLQEALRYFFAPFVLYFYFAIYDKDDAIFLAREFGLVGVAAFLVAGCVIYYLYRYLIYDIVIVWLRDLLDRETYRTYINSRYCVAPGKIWLPHHSMRAQELYFQFSYLEPLLQDPRFRLRAAGVHLLYEASLLAIPFLTLGFIHKQTNNEILFGAFVVLFALAAIRGDAIQEGEELIIMKAASTKLDEAARLAGVVSRSAAGQTKS